MQWTASLPSTNVPRLNSSQIWLLAVLSFGVGDIVTTSIGLQTPGVFELNPVAAEFFAQSVVLSIAALKLAVLGAGFAAWKWIPRPHRVGVPLGLGVLGVLVTGWNLHVIAQATLF